MPGTATKGPRRIVETHAVPFVDHAGNTALMVYRSFSKLPPLFGIAVYIVGETGGAASASSSAPPGPDPASTPSTSTSTSTSTARRDEDTNAKTAAALELFNAIQGSDWTNYRLDIYFLPSGTTKDDCKAHYLAEKAKRGTVNAQIALVESNSPESRHHNTAELSEGGNIKPPGFIPSYLCSSTGYYHHDILFLSDKNWRADGLLFVEFTLAKVNEEWEPEEEGEGDGLEEERVRRLPVLSEEREGGYGDVGGRMRELYRLGSEELEGVWQEAVRRGWVSW
ncbi:hypothetical protein QBC34DRAFT_479335 [Podospora aff. communis PSN243]|uniref:Uncharacterized protein n=1 Tax=Podospora aff. communis PSN243 TaxID=3040156 RepID=A0AAV9G4C2_9PEZI|nr:hypothetical protein QBC34DRAFT_479335 [Podospora aff. communis PSN243]